MRFQAFLFDFSPKKSQRLIQIFTSLFTKKTISEDPLLQLSSDIILIPHCVFIVFLRHSFKFHFNLKQIAVKIKLQLSALQLHEVFGYRQP